MIIAEKIQEKNENFESIKNIVKDVLSEVEDDNNQIFPDPATDLRITRTTS